jgi:hypothetical protein
MSTFHLPISVNRELHDERDIPPLQNTGWAYSTDADRANSSKLLIVTWI